MPENKPAIRFKGFENDWEQRKLGQLAMFNPKAILPNNFEYVDLESVVGTDMVNHRTETKETAPSRAQRLAVRGDVFYQTVRPYQKNNYLFELPFDNYVFSTGYAQLRPFGDSYFLLTRLQEERFVSDVLDRSTGTSYPAINASDLAEIEVSITINIEEQKLIGNFFRNLDDTITLHQQQLENLKKTKKAYLQKMFPKNNEKVPEIRFEGFADDWEQRKLGEVTDSYSGGTPLANNRAYYGGNIPFIRSAEINSSQTELFLTDEGLKESSAKMVEIGDILYALYGATSGEVGISQIKGAINQAILAIQPNESYNSRFIMQWLRLQKQSIIDKYLQGGQGNLSGSIVKNLEIYFPSYDEQQKIGIFFKQLDDTITLHQRKLDYLKEMKKGLLQKMFV